MPLTFENNFAAFEGTLRKCAADHWSLLITGKPGVGKTMMVKTIADESNVSMAYHSAPTLDPWVDFVGVPEVQTDEDGHKFLSFIRKELLMGAEWIVLDELNRCQNLKILNAVLELVQFKSLNGEPFPNLKMVWALVNPEGTDEGILPMPHVLEDRFDGYLHAPYTVSEKHFKDTFGEKQGTILTKWWKKELNDVQRDLVSPRRLEKMMLSYQSGIDMAISIKKDDHLLPLRELRESLDLGTEAFDFKYWQGREDELESAMQDDLDFAVTFVQKMNDLSDEDLVEYRDQILACPREMLRELADGNDTTMSRLLTKLINLETTGKKAIVKDFSAKLGNRLEGND